LFGKALIVAVEQRAEVLVVKRSVLLMWPSFDLADVLIGLKRVPGSRFISSVSVPVARDTHHKHFCARFCSDFRKMLSGCLRSVTGVFNFWERRL
jgi:hypothetical protein